MNFVESACELLTGAKAGQATACKKLTTTITSLFFHWHWHRVDCFELESSVDRDTPFKVKLRSIYYYIIEYNAPEVFLVANSNSSF